MISSAGLKRSVVSLGLVLAAPLSARADATVGTGTPGSCNEAAFNAAFNTVLPVGGVIRFNCGGAATISFTSQKIFYWPDSPNLTWGLDGSGLITLNGQGVTRHILHMSGTLNVANITLVNGRARGVADDSYGGAIRSDQFPGLPRITLNVFNVTFTGNVSELTGFSPPFSPFDYGGGALFTRSALLNVYVSRFTSNLASNASGGAIHGRSSTIVIDGSVFTSNASTGGGFGGAMHIDGLTPAGANGVLQITNSTFSDNSALNQGGAIFFFLHAGLGESVTIDTANFLSNRVVDSGQSYLGARGWGGGVSGDGNGTVVVRNSTFAGNTVRGQISTNGSGLGGGLAIVQNNAPISVTNCTFSGNRAIGTATDAFGGGVLIAGTAQPFVINHSTITLNQAGWLGGGIYGQSGILTNTIVANNTAGSGIQQQCSNQLSNGGGALQFPDFSGGPGDARCANGVIVANPQLGPLALNGGFSQTHHPQSGSPVIDAAPACGVGTDQRGVVRPQGARCEIGSLEVACSVSVAPLTLPTGRVGTPYSQAFTLSGGTAPFAYGLTGTLPTGMTFNTGNGVLSGTPSQSGSFPITVFINGAFACGNNRPYNLVIASTVAVNPTALAVDDPGNDVLEANQTVAMDPSWTNQTGAPVNLTGTLSSFIGPSGATYTVNDGSAAYGTIANGGTARCSNCYSLTIGASVRPATHWDASVVESLSTGGPKAWTLHVGTSFVDVPVSNLYYRFVETMLHRGITAGCTGTTYCPLNSTTREQMAVFVLVSKEGPGYVPPACAPPNIFTDVPDSSPFCRWIEELSRRGVVSGCGGSNYCPSSAVTRDQMAVFVLRTLDPALNPPACGVPMFNDVPASNAFCRWIEELARRGVVGGCGGGNYCPTSPVLRDQMGVFLGVTFGLTLYGP